MFHEHLIGLPSCSLFILEIPVEVCQIKLSSLFHLLAEHLEMDVKLIWVYMGHSQWLIKLLSQNDGGVWRNSANPASTCKWI